MWRLQPGAFHSLIETFIIRSGWPCSVTILALVLGLIFYRPITNFITRIENIRVPGVDIRLSQPKAQHDDGDRRNPLTPPDSEVRLE